MSDDDEIPRHRRLRRGIKKPYAIEARYIQWPSTKRFFGWRVWGRYRTERDMQNALEGLRKSKTELLGQRWLEFRVAAPPSAQEGEVQE